MSERVKNLVAKFDAYPVRIRCLFTLAVIVLLGLVADFLWIAENFNKAKLLNSNIVQVEETINELISAQNDLNNNIVKQRNDPLVKQLLVLEKQISQSKLALAEKTVNLVKPESMSAVLGDIILRSKNLELISLTKQPPEVLFESKGNNQSEQSKVQMYRHLVELVLEGQYKDTQKFLNEIESMPQKLNFESFEYKVESYPTSKIRLIVSTLSLERKWIGG